MKYYIIPINLNKKNGHSVQHYYRKKSQLKKTKKIKKMIIFQIFQKNTISSCIIS